LPAADPKLDSVEEARETAPLLLSSRFKPRVAPVTSKPKQAAAPRAAVKPKPRVSSGFPAKIDRALRYNPRVVVVSVSMPRAAVDSIVAARLERARAPHAPDSSRSLRRTSA
jgi:hypothetical protein